MTTLLINRHVTDIILIGNFDKKWSHMKMQRPLHFSVSISFYINSELLKQMIIHCDKLPIKGLRSTNEYYLARDLYFMIIDTNDVYCKSGVNISADRWIVNNCARDAVKDYMRVLDFNVNYDIAITSSNVVVMAGIVCSWQNIFFRLQGDLYTCYQTNLSVFKKL